MEHTEEILEIVREIREDVSYMKRHRNSFAGCLFWKSTRSATC